MFKNLIKLNHDGIIITQNDNIFFFNQQMNSILNIPNISTTKAAEHHLNKFLNAQETSSRNPNATFKLAPLENNGSKVMQSLKNNQLKNK